MLLKKKKYTKKNIKNIKISKSKSPVTSSFINHTKNYAFLYKTITFTFKQVAKLNNFPEKEVKTAVEEYFAMIHEFRQSLKSRSRLVGGAGPSGAGPSGAGPTSFAKLYQFTHWIYTRLPNPIECAIGTFDTPCNIILSLIAIGTWSVCVYNMYYEVPPETAHHSLAMPVQYILYNAFPPLYTGEEIVYQNSVNITNVVVDYVLQNVANNEPIRSSLSNILVGTSGWFYNSVLYQKLFQDKIVCLLALFIDSCYKRCYPNKTNTKTKKTKTKSTSIKSSKSHYYTPKTTKTKTYSSYHTPYLGG